MKVLIIKEALEQAYNVLQLDIIFLTINNFDIIILNL